MLLRCAIASGCHEVVLIGRSALVEAVRTHGLRLQAEGFDGFLPLQVDTSPSAVAGAGLVLFCVKSGDTESAGAAMAPFLAADCTVLNMQNGVDNAARLAQVLRRETVPVAVYVAVGMAAPGHVVHYGRCELVLGPASGSEAAARLLNAAAIPTTVTPSVHEALWTKLTINCAYNALSALTQIPYGELVQRPGIVPTIHAIVDECRAVAQGERHCTARQHPRRHAGDFAQHGGAAFFDGPATWRVASAARSSSSTAM